MQDAGGFAAVLSGVEELGLFQAPRRLYGSQANGGAGLEGRVTVEDRQVTLQLVLGPSFPLELPRFRLRPWDALGLIPHVDPWGFVCFLDPEGLLLDRRRPVQIIENAFQRTIQVLADGVAGRNWSDFADEFEVYWGRLSESVIALSMLDPGDDARYVLIATSSQGAGTFIFVGDSEAGIREFYKGMKPGKKLTLQKGLYLPLEPGTLIIPPRHDKPFWAAEHARQVLLSGLSEGNQARLQELMKKHTYITEYVIAKLPRPSGGATLFGIRFDQVGGRHPLLERGTSKRLVPLSLMRQDLGYLVQRGGGDTVLSTKRVLLVGCGAVGGHLAFELARAGVLDLTLVDHDILAPENTLRHVLGRRYWSKSKAEALKEEIEAQLSYVRVAGVHDTIEKVLATGVVDLAHYDLVVLAIGKPTVELAINERLKALQGGPTALFTWVEPLGIGGHALLTRNTPDGGCFECLYTPLQDSEEELENRAAFAAPGQSFGRALSGCGSLYTPYGSIDAVRTAVLAARLAVDALTGKECGSPLLSWKGDATMFESAGFRLSDRYSATENELFNHRYNYQSPRCQVCGAKARGST